MLRPHPRYIPLTYFVTHLRGLSRVLKERFQNERRMNSFWGTLCMLKNVDAAPSVPVHVRLGRYAGGGSQRSQSPLPPTGEDRVRAQPLVLEGPCPRQAQEVCWRQSLRITKSSSPDRGRQRACQPLVLGRPCPEGHTRKRSTFVLKMQRTITSPSELRRMA